MTYDFLKKTGQMKPFSSVEEFEKFEQDLIKLPNLDTFSNTSIKKSKIKRGVDLRSNKYDSFAEFTLVQYMTLIKNYIVERNHKNQFLTYIDTLGKTHKFYPDFLINGQFAECKGRITEKDQCKIQQCSNVNWFFQDDINLMSKELDTQFPYWKTEFIQTN